jgi:hypothetical protein
MKISKETIEVLKNFARINPNLLIKKGSTLRTMNGGPDTLAYAGVVEKFPVDVAIYDLNQFLGVLHLDTDADITFGAKSLTTKHLEFFYADPKIIKSPPDKGIPLGLIQLDFVLTAADILAFQKSAAVLSVGCFSVVSDGETVTIVIGEPNTPSSNTYKHVIGPCDKKFDYRMSMDNLLVLPDTYNVSLSKRTADNKDVGIIYFKSQSRDLQYWFAADPSSTV